MTKSFLAQIQRKLPSIEQGKHLIIFLIYFCKLAALLHLLLFKVDLCYFVKPLLPCTKKQLSNLKRDVQCACRWQTLFDVYKPYLYGV